jgi:flagellar hook protein FlgE
MSFGTGLSGLNAASKNLDVIGHNIANAQHDRHEGWVALNFLKCMPVHWVRPVAATAESAWLWPRCRQLFTQGNLKVTGNNMDIADQWRGLVQSSHDRWVDGIHA